MAYVTFTLQQKIARLTELEQRQALGPVKTSQQGGGVRTEFDTKDINLDAEIKKLMAAIWSDPDFTSENPIYARISAARRPGRTLPVFQ